MQLHSVFLRVKQFCMIVGSSIFWLLSGRIAIRDIPLVAREYRRARENYRIASDDFVTKGDLITENFRKEMGALCFELKELEKQRADKIITDEEFFEARKPILHKIDYTRALAKQRLVDALNETEERYHQLNQKE